MCSFYLLLAVVPQYAAAQGVGGVAAGLTTGVLMCTSVATELAMPRLSRVLDHRRLLAVGLVLLGAPVAAAAGRGRAGRAAGGLRGARRRLRDRRRGGRHPGRDRAAGRAPRRGAGRAGRGHAWSPRWPRCRSGSGSPRRPGSPSSSWSAPCRPPPRPLLTFGLPRTGADDEGSLGIWAGLRHPALAGPTVMFGATAVASGVVVTFLAGAVADGGVVVAALAAAGAGDHGDPLAGRAVRRPARRRPAAGPGGGADRGRAGRRSRFDRQRAPPCSAGCSRWASGSAWPSRRA